MNEVENMNWYMKCLASTAVTVDTRAYQQSLRELVMELVSREEQEAQRFHTFQPNVAALQAALAEAQFTNPQPIIHAVQINDPNEISNATWQVYTAMRELGMDNFNAYSALRKAWNMLRDCERFAESGGKVRYDAAQADGHMVQIVAKTQVIMDAIKNAIEAAIGRANWQGSTVVIEARTVSAQDEYLEPVNGAEVKVGGSVGGRLTPSFTCFYGSDGKLEVDDVLEGGDDDFFGNPANTADYFSLIQEIRRPGSTNSKGKMLTLYTARPTKDRKQYQHASMLPPNLFLTNRFSSAAGIAHDLGSNEVRDVWLVKIDSRYLVETLNTGSERQYQIVGANPVPVVRMELYQPGA